MGRRGRVNAGAMPLRNRDSMKFGLFHAFVMLTVLAANLAAVTSTSAEFTNAVNVLTYLLVSATFAGLASPRQRPFWIAYVSTTSVFMVLILSKSIGITALVNKALMAVSQSGALPAADQAAGYFPLINLQSSLESLLPPVAGLISGIVARLTLGTTGGADETDRR